VVNDGIVCVARHEEHLHLRTDGRQPLGQSPFRPRHDHIGEEKIDGSAVLLANQEGSSPSAASDKMLKAHGDWMPLGSADEQKLGAKRNSRSLGSLAEESGGAGTGSKRAAEAGSVCYVPSVMEELGLAEVE
jgi:hypothetical protein